VYLGLPMTGARGPAGGRKEVVRPGTDGQVLSAGPMVEQAVARFPAVVAALRERLPVDDGPIGLLDGSLGAVAVWLDVVAWADQIAARDSQPALLVTGARDDPRRPRAGRAAMATLASRYRDPSVVGLVIVPGLGSMLAEEPGLHRRRGLLGQRWWTPRSPAGGSGT
jgi:hypothetical protein